MINNSYDINETNNHLSPKESLNWWSTIPTISTNQTNHLSLQLTVHKKKNAAYDVRNPGRGLGETHNFGGVKSFFLLIFIDCSRLSTI